MKFSPNEKYVNDKYGYKKEKYPSADHVFLIQAFEDRSKKTDFEKIEFYQQVPSKLSWHDSMQDNCKYYLSKGDFVEFVSVEDSYDRFGSFPKKVHPDDDLEI